MTTLDGRRVAYQDAWARAHLGAAARPGVTWTRANAYIDWMHWLRPDRRLDYIFMTPVRRDRRGTVHGARVVFDEPRVAAATARACSRRITSASSPTCRWSAEPAHAAP